MRAGWRGWVTAGLVGLAVLESAPAAVAQDGAPQPAPARPRIGLALGGGAARGFAHLGVLKWLDEHRIPVDMVGGTSMGALIGSTLATDMTPDEAWALLVSMDWASMLAPDSPFPDKTFRRKEAARAFPSVLEFGLKRGFRLPTGFSPAQQASLFFDHVAAPYFDVATFGDLPVPFACVAVDLRTSTAVVLDRGRLEEALRATMAIPGLFVPVRIGDQVLVDGGVLNNLPADVVKGMGADVVIAVDVGRDLSRPRQSDTLFRVLAETLDTIMRAPVRQALTAADIVITPDLSTFTGADFGRVSELINQGYSGAEARRDELIRYALTDEQYRAHLAARSARRRAAIPVPAFVAVEGVAGAQAAVIRRQLARHVGQALSLTALERDLTLLTGSDRYDSITYRLATVDGRTGLVITAREKTYAPPYLNVAIDLQNAESSTVSAALRARVTAFDVLTPGSETRLDVGLGQTTHAGAEWYLAVGTRGLFVAPRASYTRDDANLFRDDRYAADYRRLTRAAAVDVGYTTGRSLEVRAGYTTERITGEVRLGEPFMPAINGRQEYWRAQVTVDRQSSPVVPDRGVYARAGIRRFTRTIGVDDEAAGLRYREPGSLMIAETRLSYYKGLGHRGRLFAAGSAGWSFGDRTLVNTFSLGRPFELSAYQPDELRGSNVALANVGYLYEVARIVEGVVGRLYAGAWVEHGSAFERLRDARMHTNVSGGFIMETVIGPAFVTGSVGLDGRSRVYIGLGPVFRR